MTCSDIYKSSSSKASLLPRALTKALAPVASYIEHPNFSSVAIANRKIQNLEK
jgi:hypothetical protein